MKYFVSGRGKKRRKGPVEKARRSFWQEQNKPDSRLLSWHALKEQATMLEKPKWQGSKSSLWPKALKELNPASNHVPELENRSFPSQAFRCDPNFGLNLECKLLEGSEPQDPARLCPDSLPTET